VIPKVSATFHHIRETQTEPREGFVHHEPTAGMRTHRPDVCCDHEWHLDTYTGCDSHASCAECPAACRRDKDGSIVEYSADGDLGEVDPWTY
jgi:hypothetical protein